MHRGSDARIGSRAATDSDETRALMARLISVRRMPHAADLIRPLLMDENPGVRATAVIGLRSLDDPKAWEYLKDCSEETHPEVLHHLMLIVGNVMITILRAVNILDFTVNKGFTVHLPLKPLIFIVESRLTMTRQETNANSKMRKVKSIPMQVTTE